MATERLKSLEQVRAFVEGSDGLDFVGSDRPSRNDFVRRVLVKFEYGTLGKADKGLVKRFLIPVLEGLLHLFPFVIKGFHADNGSEYVNRRVAALLEKLRAEFTRSRPRRSNNNALVESKNASVVRRHLGHAHIPARLAPLVHRFACDVLSPHLNFHRPCLFATPVADKDGKVRKVYRDNDVATPYERLKSIEGAERFLKPGISFTALDIEANAISDLQSARLVNRERDKLFQVVGAAWPSAA